MDLLPGQRATSREICGRVNRAFLVMRDVIGTAQRLSRIELSLGPSLNQQLLRDLRTVQPDTEKNQRRREVAV